MRGVSFAGMDCSIARTLEVVGERWTLLIVRDALSGVRRFDDFRQSLGIARNILTDRLETLVANGILERQPYQQRPERFEYRLTTRGRDLYPVLLALMQWGDRHLCTDDAPPSVVLHRTCDAPVVVDVRCPACNIGPRRADPCPLTRRARLC